MDQKKCCLRILSGQSAISVSIVSLSKKARCWCALLEGGEVVDRPLPAARSWGDAQPWSSQGRYHSSLQSCRPSCLQRESGPQEVRGRARRGATPLRRDQNASFSLTHLPFAVKLGGEERDSVLGHLCMVTLVCFLGPSSRGLSSAWFTSFPRVVRSQAWIPLLNFLYPRHLGCSHSS